MTDQDKEEIAREVRILKSVSEMFTLEETTKKFISKNILQGKVEEDRLTILFRFMETWPGNEYLKWVENNRKQ